MNATTTPTTPSSAMPLDLSGMTQEEIDTVIKLGGKFHLSPASIPSSIRIGPHQDIPYGHTLCRTESPGGEVNYHPSTLFNAALCLSKNPSVDIVDEHGESIVDLDRVPSDANSTYGHAVRAPYDIVRLFHSAGSIHEGAGTAKTHQDDSGDEIEMQCLDSTSSARADTMKRARTRARQQTRAEALKRFCSTRGSVMVEIPYTYEKQDATSRTTGRAGGASSADFASAHFLCAPGDVAAHLEAVRTNPEHWAYGADSFDDKSLLRGIAVDPIDPTSQVMSAITADGQTAEVEVYQSRCDIGGGVDWTPPSARSESSVFDSEERSLVGEIIRLGPDGHPRAGAPVFRRQRDPEAGDAGLELVCTTGSIGVKGEEQSLKARVQLRE